MKKRARWLLAVMLTVAMTLSCMPVASAAGSRTAKGNRTTNPWGINVDLSGVPAQVQATVANMIAQGEEPMEKETDEFLVEVVEEASGISFEAVKGSLGLELLSGTEGAMDTSRFNLGEEEFNRVMKEVLSEYFLTNVAYDYEVEDGIVTGLWFMPAIDADSYRGMFTASDLWSMYRTPLTAASLSASRLANDPLPEDETEGTGTEGTGTEGEDETDPKPEPANDRPVTLQVKWKDNNKKSNRPERVKVYLDDGKDSSNNYYYLFSTVKDGEVSIVVPNKDSEGNTIKYEIAEEGVVNGRLEGRKDAFYKVTTSQDGNTYTVINTADGKNGEEYDVAFNWGRDDQYVPATQDEIDKGHSIDIGIGYPVALTLVYDAEKKEVGYGPKTTIDFELNSVTLTPKDGDGSEKIVLEPTEENGVHYETMYAFGEYESQDRADFGENAEYASTIKYATYDCKYGTFEDRKDVTACAEQIHWNQMLTFTRDYAKYFGVAGDFWTSKNTEKTPYGAFKTQIDSYPEDYIPDAAMDHTMEMMTLAYMSDEMNYGDLLDQRIKDCMDQLDDSMTDVQKYLVIHDWMANNCLFDMGLMSDMMAGTGANPTPSQMTAFGALLYDVIPKNLQDPSQGTLDGCICLGYSSTYALLIQHAFPEVYQDSDGKWLNQEQVGENDIVDLVQIRFYGKLSDISVSPEFGGDGYFNSVHYYNAVKVTQKDGTSSWYCVDSAYDDINPEVMSQCRVETDGNISHKYFMISPVNMLGMFEDRIDYIDCLYDGVYFWRNPVKNEDGSYAYETDENDHVVWYNDAPDENGNQTKHENNHETPYDDDRYEATWFSGAVGEITHDGNYWYYVTGPSFSYASMLSLMNKMQSYEGEDKDELGNLFNSDDPADKDRLVRRPMDPEKAPDEPDDSCKKTVSVDFNGQSIDREVYDDAYDEILFHFGYGSVVPDEDLLEDENATEEEKQGEYYDEVLVDEAYYDLYPDLVHSMGLYKGVLYFNFGNKIYTMTGATSDSLDGVAITLLKEYNDVYANSNGKNFTGMSFYAAEEGEDNAFHVFNRPIAAVSIEDKVNYKPVTNEKGEVVGMQRDTEEPVTPTLTVSIGTNFSESNKDEDGNAYTLEALDYNPDYSMYNKKEPDDKYYELENSNEEFLWCANVVDTMPMEAMLEELASEETAEEAEDTEDASEANEDDEYVTVTIRAWCGQAGYTEKRTAEFGLSVAGRRTVNEEDPALNHHFIKNEREDCYVCVHCNDSWHEEYPEDYDGFEPKDENATYEHYDYDEGETPEFVNIEWAADYSACTAQLKCAERYCDAAISDTVDCTVKDETIDGSDGNTYRVFTATDDMGNVVDKQYPDGKPAYTLGDVNDDGGINLKDVVLLRQYYAGGDVTVNELAADVNGDGAVTLKDVVLLRQYYAGWDVQLGKSEDAE